MTSTSRPSLETKGSLISMCTSSNRTVVERFKTINQLAPHLLQTSTNLLKTSSRCSHLPLNPSILIPESHLRSNKDKQAAATTISNSLLISLQCKHKTSQWSLVHRREWLHHNLCRLNLRSRHRCNQLSLSNSQFRCMSSNHTQMLGCSLLQHL